MSNTLTFFENHEEHAHFRDLLDCWKEQNPEAKEEEVESKESLAPEGAYFDIGSYTWAGKYCHDCMVTLHPKGQNWIHGPCLVTLSSCPNSQQEVHRDWELLKTHKIFECPECAKPAEEVGGTNSFSFSVSPQRVNMLLEKNLDSVCVIDENNETMTGREAIRFLKEDCLIHFTHLI